LPDHLKLDSFNPSPFVLERDREGWRQEKMEGRDNVVHTRNVQTQEPIIKDENPQKEAASEGGRRG